MPLPWLHTDLLILQPTPFCNLDCTYCYLPARDDRRRMPIEVADAAFRTVLGSRLVGGRLTACWHAGEPLVVPPDWYERAFAAAERWRPADLDLRHSLQSNGTLLDAEWIALLRRWPAEVSLSLDGPAWLHDARRRTRRGGPTHARTMRGLTMLQDAGFHPPVITVLSRDALDCPDEMYEFYRSAGIRDVAFNVEEIEAAHAGTALLDPEYEAAFGAFLARFMTRRLADRAGPDLRELRGAVAVLAAGGVPDGANQETQPMRIVSVTAEGDVSTYSPELLGMRDSRYGDFTFGNVLRDPLEEIAARVLASRLHADIQAGVAACRRNCAWHGACGGGSPANRLYETGSFRIHETAYCRLTRQAVLRTVLGLGESAMEHDALRAIER